jgi:GntR family transcriptional regulator/MocR family aminotransferase
VTAAPVPAATPPPGQTPARYDFRPGVPDLATFPRAEWLRAARTVLATLPAADLGYGDPRGHPAARAEIAAYLGRVRGVAADPGSLLLTNGMAQGMRLLAETLAATGIAEVAVEDPSHPGAREQMASGGVAVRPVPVDADGLDVAALRRTGARAVLTAPAHQFPTGAVLGADRRRDLVAWADSVDGYVVEDDYDAEYRYDREPVGAVAGLDPRRVCYAGTASKSLAPSVRIGWLALPPALVEVALRRKYLADLGSPALDQLTLAEMIRSGAWDRHLRRTRRIYRARRDLIGVICERAGWAVTGVAAGLHCLLPLPDGVDEVEVAVRARQQSVRVYPLSAYRVRPGPPGLVLGYGDLDEREITIGLSRLLDILRETGERNVDGRSVGGGS